MHHNYLNIPKFWKDLFERKIRNEEFYYPQAIIHEKTGIIEESLKQKTEVFNIITKVQKI